MISWLIERNFLTVRVLCHESWSTDWLCSVKNHAALCGSNASSIIAMQCKGHTETESTFLCWNSSANPLILALNSLFDWLTSVSVRKWSLWVMQGEWGNLMKTLAPLSLPLTNDIPFRAEGLSVIKVYRVHQLVSFRSHHSQLKFVVPHLLSGFSQFWPSKSYNTAFHKHGWVVVEVL